jgi:hypothetical protein
MGASTSTSRESAPIRVSHVAPCVCSRVPRRRCRLALLPLVLVPQSTRLLRGRRPPLLLLRLLVLCPRQSAGGLRPPPPPIRSEHQRQLPSELRQLPSDKRQLPSDKRQLPSDKRQLPSDKRQLPSQLRQRTLLAPRQRRQRVHSAQVSAAPRARAYSAAQPLRRPAACSAAQRPHRPAACLAAARPRRAPSMTVGLTALPVASRRKAHTCASSARGALPVASGAMVCGIGSPAPGAKVPRLT